MKNGAPSVSVLMPVYNASKYLRDAIESILNQTFEDFEFIVINDGSTDSSEEIILSYSDSRIKYYKNETNIRLIATLNKGIELCNGKYIVRMDADDISLPMRIEKQFYFMESHPEVAICGSWFESFGKNSGIGRYSANHSDIMFKMLYQCHLCHPSLILRKSSFEQMDYLFDPNFAHAEDYDLFVRIGQRFRIANIQEVLVKYRHHEGSVSSKYSEIQQKNSNIIRRRQFDNLGCEITEKLLADFIRLNYHDYFSIESTAKEIRTLLENMISGNKETAYFDQSFFLKKVTDLWFNYCYHLSNSNQYFSSKILSTYRPNVVQLLKWRVKSIFSK